MSPLATCHPSLVTRRLSAAAFTLIELLVVIAIIAILAGLGFAGLQGAMESGRKAQARNDVQQIAAAIRAFELEFGRQPDNQTSSEQWISDNSTVIKALMGEDNGLNPKGIRFLEAKKAKGTPPKGGIDEASKTFYDPWGEPYFIKLNTDYDNVLEYYGDNYVAVIVGSKGPNKEQENPATPGADDLLNFK
jgi:prepilin-type N-terminal cleavage/methylation domain-containing protein